MVPKFDSEWEGVQRLSYIIWSTPLLYRNIDKDFAYCMTVWKHFPMAEIWYEEFGPMFWELSYRCNTHGEMGVFGND